MRNFSATFVIHHPPCVPWWLLAPATACECQGQQHLGLGSAGAATEMALCSHIAINKALLCLCDSPKSPQMD